MKPWKIWFWSTIGVLLMCIIAVFSALWNYLSTGWEAERTAAQVALDSTPLQALTDYTVYSGPGGVEDVFRGQDSFHRTGIAFIRSAHELAYIPAQRIIPQEEAGLLAKRYVGQSYHSGFRVTEASLGALSNSAKYALHTTAKFVWEVTYRAQTQYGYLYIDAVTGALLWK